MHETLVGYKYAFESSLPISEHNSNIDCVYARNYTVVLWETSPTGHDKLFPTARQLVPTSFDQSLQRNVSHVGHDSAGFSDLSAIITILLRRRSLDRFVLLFLAVLAVNTTQISTTEWKWLPKIILWQVPRAERLACRQKKVAEALGVNRRPLLLLPPLAWNKRISQSCSLRS